MTESAQSANAELLCPSCKTVLVMTERQNIEIDYCPKCRGVWLDRGELDKIIERSLSQPREQAAAPQRPAEAYGGYERQDHGHYGKHGDRRKSWLAELFD